MDKRDSRWQKKNAKKLAKDKARRKTYMLGGIRKQWLPPSSNQGPTVKELRERAAEIKRLGQERSWFKYWLVKIKTIIQRLWQ